MAVYNRDTTSKTKTKTRKTTEAKKTFVEQFRAEAEKRAEEQRKREEERLKKQQAAQIEKERRERFAPKTGSVANYDAETERLRRIGGAYGQMAADARSLIPGAAKLTLSNQNAFVQQTGAPIKNVMERNPAIQQGVMAGAKALNDWAKKNGDKATEQLTRQDYDRAMNNLKREQTAARVSSRERSPVVPLAQDYSKNELSWMAQQAEMASQFENNRRVRLNDEYMAATGNDYEHQNLWDRVESAQRAEDSANERLTYIQMAQELQDKWKNDAKWQNTVDRLASDPNRDSRAARGEAAFRAGQNQTVGGKSVNYLDAAKRLTGLTDEQRKNFYTIYETNPEAAFEYAKWENDKRVDKALESISEWSGRNQLTRDKALLAGTLINLGSGLAPVSSGGALASRVGQAFLGGGAAGLQEKGLFNTGKGAGTLPDKIPIIGGKGLGDVYTLSSSMLQSYMTAGLGIAFGKVGEALGLALMGSSAANNDYAELLGKGVDNKTAAAHAVAAGVAEALFEKLSIENFIKPDLSKGVLRYWFQQAGIEASEEIFTSLANRLSDELIMDASGYRSAVEERQHELIMSGVPYADAKAQAEKEWVVEVLNDGLGGALSGGFMSVGSTLGYGVEDLVNRRNVTNKIRYNVGSRIANNADLTAALNEYAAQNNLAGISAADIETTKSMNERLTKQVTGETKTEGQQQTKAEKRQQATETKAARRVGKQAAAILDNIAKRMDNKTMREYEKDAVSVMEQNKKLRQMVENEAYYRSLELYSRAKDLKTLDQFHSDNAKGVKDEGLRKAALNAYQDAAERLADTNDTAARATRTARQILHNGALDLSASYESDGETKRAMIQRFADDTSKVVLDNGETRSINDLDLDQDTAEILQMIHDRELSATNANDVLNWYQMSVKNNDVTSGYAFVDDFISAMDKGRNNSATEAQVVQRYSDLGERAAKAAYSIGRNAALQAAKAAQGQRNAARQTYKAGDTVTTDTVNTKWKGATGREGTVDMTAVKGMTLDAQQAQQIALATGLARALGADVEVIASKLVDGKYVGHQGSYSNGKIQIDINAGRLYEGDLQSGVLKTMSHELTHFIQDYSPEQYQGLKDFAFEILGQKMGIDSFEDLVDSKIARSKDGISRLEAEDEVLADACETMLRDSKAVEQLYKQNATLADNILNWLADFIGKVRLNLGPADHEEARIIDALEKDLRAAFQERWDNALADAAQAHSEIGELESAGESQHSTRSLMEATGFNVSLEGGRVVAYDQDGNRVTKVTPEHIKQSGYGAMIDYAQNVTKVISAADARKQRQGLADLMNLMLKAQDGEMVWKFAGASLFSAVRTNSDGQYGTTIDFSTVCRKTQEMMDAMSEDMVELGRGLSKEEVTQLQKKIFEAGGTVPCPVCYVFSRWAGVGQILDNIKKFQEKYDHSWDDAKKLDDRIQFLTKATKTKADMRAALMEYDLHYQDLSLEVDHAKDENAQLKRKRTGLNKKKGVDVTAEVAEINKQIARNEAIIKANTEEMKELEKDGTPELAWLKRVRCHEDKNNKGHYLPNEDYWEHGFVGDAKTVTTSNQDLFDLTKADRFAEQYPLAWGYRTTRGPSAGKAILPYSDMRLGDLALGPGKNSAQGKQTFSSVQNGFNKDQRKAMESAVERTKAQNLIGGQRFQSTSDFRYDYGVDYLQAFFELQALGGKMQTYTKIVEFAEMVGAMGGDVNLSVMPLGKGVDKNGNLIYSSVTGIDYETAKSITHAYDSAQLILVGINDEHINAALDDNAGKGGIEVGFVIPYHASGASINEFIRALVSNLGEDFVKENYKDYSKLQTDSRKKVTGAKAETVKGWLDAMRENPENPAFQGRQPNARQLAELRRMFKQEIRSAILRRTVPSAYKTEGETVEDAAARFLDTCQNMIAGESKDISGMSFDELRSIEKSALDGDADAIAEYESWSAGVLADLYNKMWVDESRDDTYGVTLTKAQAEAIMPHEYWNKEVDRAHAYVNGFIFRSYCYSMGLIPRFTGLNSDGADMGYGDFSENTGYWKTLIDRAMYANDGSYREQQAINVTNISEKLNEDTNILDPRYAQEKYGDKKVREPSAATAHKAAQAFLEDVRKKEGEKVQHSERDTEYLSLAKDPEKNRARLQEMVDEAANSYIQQLLLPNDDDEAGFKYHRGPAPTKTFKRYAVMNVSPDGFRAAYAGNKNATPIGVWLDAQNLQSYTSDLVQFDDGTFATYIPGDTGAATNTKFSSEAQERLQLRGGQRWLLERGGKHSSDVPNFSQMNLRQNESGEKVSSAKEGALPHNKLVFEIEYGISDNGDLTDYVRKNGRMMRGKNQGLQHIHPNQYYDFKTNPNAVGNWGIGGTFRITRLVPHSEIVSKTNEYKANAIAEANRLYDAGEITLKDRNTRIKNAEAVQVQKWVNGYHPEDFGLSEKIVASMAKHGSKMKLTDPVTYDDAGNVIPLSERFNPEQEDIRYSEREQIDPNYIVPRNDVEKGRMSEVQKRAENTTKWQGRPILAYERAGSIFGITGSHRIAVAKLAGYDVDAVVLRENELKDIEKYLDEETYWDLDDFLDHMDEWDQADVLNDAVSKGYVSLKDAASIMNAEVSSNNNRYPNSQNVKYSERDNTGGEFDGMTEEDLLKRKNEVLKEYQTARIKYSELADNDEYTALLDRAVTSGSDEAFNAVENWQNEHGLNDAYERLQQAEKTYHETWEKIDRTLSNLSANAEKESIKKSGLSENKYFHNAAVKAFGLTSNFAESGYILTNGKMLNMSGQKGAHYGIRTDDHRAIGRIFANDQGSDAMLRFMQYGNIRMSYGGSSGFLDISNAVSPSSEQYSTIKNFVEMVKDKGQPFYVDFTGKDGETVGTLDYESNVYPPRVINDIRHFFETGEVRQPSGLSQFYRYSERDESLLSDNRVLIEADESVAQNEEQRRMLKEYKAKQKQLSEITRKYEKLAAEVRGYEGDHPNRISVGDFTRNVLDEFSIPSSLRGVTREMLESIAEHVLSGGKLTDDDVYSLFSYLVTNGKAKSTTDETLSAIRDDLKGRRIYVNEDARKDFGDDWSAFRKRAFGLGIYLTTNQSDPGFDTVNMELAENYPGSFDADETDARIALENIVDTAESGKTSEISLLDALRENERLTGEPAAVQLQDMMDQLKRHIDIMQDRARVEARARAGNAAEIEKAKERARKAEEKLKEVRKEKNAWKGKAERVDSRIDKALRAVIVKDAKQIAAAVEQKQRVMQQLEKQIQREKDILAGKLKPPAMQAMLKNAREEIRKKKDAKIYEMRESKNKKEMLRRITNLRKDLVNRIMKPTDRSYVPAELAQSLVDVLDILNMSPTPGAKGAEKYSSLSEAIHKMGAAYAGLVNQGDSLLRDDFDTDLSGAITALATSLSGIRVQDLSSAEMRDVYDKVKRIRDYLRDSNKMIGKENAATIREYGDRIISEQNKIEDRKKGYRKVHSLLNELSSGAQINALSAMRAIKMIGGWTEDSALYELWKDIENGNEIRSNVVMDSNKTMQPLRTGRNEKTYMNALHNKLDYGIKDTKGKLVKMTKLQAIQLYMTWQREATSDKLSHLQKGLVEIRDANLMIKGKINSAERTAQRFKMTPEIAKKLFDSFSDWDKAYMKAARDVFHRILEDSNKVMYALRHTVMPGEDMYVPIVVDRNYLTTEVNEAEATQIGVKNPGSTKPLENNSTKPVIIDGLDTVLNKHITDMSSYIGLAVPIRNFVKAWNVTSEVSPDEKVSVKDAITKAWGGTANQMMMDVLRQIQNVKSNDYKTGFDRFSQKLAGYFAKSALVGRVSVVAKQAASYAAGGSVLSQAALNSAQQYILPIFASPNSKMAQSIYARADRLTPELYNRRQGMSMVEIANERLRGGMIRQAWDKAGASMEQSKIGRGARRALNWLNPYDWIQRMDVATTTALYVACEHQAKMEKLTPNTPEFDSRVRELYNRVIRETQPMYDPLYRNQLQKSKAGGVLQAAFPFKTVPFQNYGQIMDSIGSWQEAMRSGTKEQKTQAAKHMGATIFANFMSALVFAGLTVLGNGVAMHKMKKWRDDDEELTPESFLLQYSKDVGSVMLSNILPYGGSELMEIIERIGTDKNSYFDIFSVGSIELINDTVNSIIKTINKWQDDDASEEDKIQQTAEMIFQTTTMFGLPARNIRDVVNGVKANIQDVRNGNLPAFNNDVDRTNTVNANRYYKAVMSGDTGKAEAVLNEMRANTSGTQKEINQKVRGDINDRVKKAYQNGEMDLDGYISFLGNTGLWEPDALADKAAKAVNELYTDGRITEDEAISLLGKYKGMDEDEAWFKVQEWADKAQAVQDALDAGLDADQAEDVSTSKYRRVYDAIDSNDDITDAVNDMVDHGFERAEVNKKVKEYLKDKYVNGEITEQALKGYLSRYLGITKRDEVNEILTSANNAIRKQKFDAEHPEVEWTVDQITNYYDKKPKTGSVMKTPFGAGISVATYNQYLEKAKTVTGTDNDHDGKTDSGSVKQAYIYMVDKIPGLSKEQKELLLRLKYDLPAKKNEDKEYDIPWHK